MEVATEAVNVSVAVAEPPIPSNSTEACTASEKEVVTVAVIPVVSVVVTPIWTLFESEPPTISATKDQDPVFWKKPIFAKQYGTLFGLLAMGAQQHPRELQSSALIPV